MQYAELEKMLEEVLLEELSARGAAQSKSFAESIAHLKLNVRLYYIDQNTVINNIWDHVRSDEGVLDTLLRATMAFNMRLACLQPDGITAFTQRIVSSIFISQHESAVVDKDFRSKLPTMSSLNGVLTHEQWLSFLIFCTYNYAVVDAVVTRLYGQKT